VKPWRTVPGSGDHATATGALRTASANVHGVVRQEVEGISIMPPSKPRSGRRRSSTAPSARVSQNTTPWRSGRSGLSARAGKNFRQPAGRGGAASSPRAEHTARPARRADHGAEIHQRLGKVAGAPLRNQCGGECRQTRFSRPATAPVRRRGGR